MRRAVVRLLPFLAVLPVLPAAAGVGVEPLSGDPFAFLRTEARLSAPELANLGRGGVLAKVIQTDDRSEVLSFAAVRVSTTASRVLDQLRDLGGRRTEPWTLQSGRLGSIPSPDDFATLSLDERDIRDLPKCRLHACEVRLPKDEMEALSKELLATPPSGRPARANLLFREMLARYVTAYRQHGNPALYEYVNNDDPVRIGDSLKLLLPRLWFLREAAPDVWRYLADFPSGRPQDAEDFIYWVKERFWLLNVLSLSQMTIVDRATPSGRLIVAASKQLYATHYYESSLGVTLFVENRGADSYLILIDRTRADIRRGGFTWVERVLLNHLVRRRIEGRIKRLQLVLRSATGPTTTSEPAGAVDEALVP
jgi:hypothetical protein